MTIFRFLSYRFIATRQSENKGGLVKRDIWALDRGSKTTWRKLHNDELHNVFPSPHFMGMMGSVGDGAHVREVKSTYEFSPVICCFINARSNIL
jgi:hypothetical protein